MRRSSVIPAVLAAALACSIANAPRCDARVYLNELTVQGAEVVELYNSGPLVEDLTGWKIDSVPGGILTIPPGTMIGSGAYVNIVIPPPGIFPDAGAEGALIDDASVTVDRVSFGVVGSAPLPAATAFALTGPPTLARAPDAADGTPPLTDRYTDGNVWTIAFSPTFGSHNNAPVPEMGSSLRINEIDPKPIGGLDHIELMNPAPSPRPSSGFFVTNGVGTFALLGPTIPPGGVVVFQTPGGYDLESFGLLYLFEPDGTRVDQAGFWADGPRGAPTLDSCETYGRFPNGAGPSLGFDFESSGGGTTFFPLTSSLGVLNPYASCGHSGVAAPVVETGTWGQLRQLFR